MSISRSRLPWAQPGWLDEICAWITEQLSSLGIQEIESIEQIHIRPWSTVLRAATPWGYFFCKASAPVLAHEPGLTGALCQWRSDCLQTVLAVDVDRAWMLMPDESPTLRTLIKTPADLYHWETILPIYANVQREFTTRTGELLAQGMLDRRLLGLPDQFEKLLAEPEALLIDQEDGLTSEQYRQLISLVPAYREMCARLATFGIPETLHHDDFHDANVFVPDHRYAFSDWGESCVTHPFFTMLVTLRSIAYRFDWPYGAGEHNYAFAPEILQLRDLYLEQWKEYGTAADLLQAFQLAWKVAMVNRALTWHYVVSHLDEADQAKNASAVPAWLGEFLDAMAQPPV